MAALPAFKKFLAWLDPTTELGAKTKINLRYRVGNFNKGVANKRVTDAMPEHVESYLASKSTRRLTRSSPLG